MEDHFDNPDAFADTLVEELKGLPSVWNPISTTTESGFQTQGNLFERPLRSIAPLTEMLKKEIISYCSKFEKSNCAFIASWPKEWHLHGWAVRLTTSGHQSAHIHASGWLSGVVYLQLVPSENKDEGAIVFGSDGYDYPLLHENVAETLHRPSRGDIVFFPSSLFHRTIPIRQEGERIIVAFDVVPRA
ncbi:MAG: putative 2OG-Fe(II) oxygenase [Alphaproteobacteria bacterium]